MIRNATRALARTPGMALSAIFCIALGIGGTTAVASAVGRALIQRLPFRNTDELVAVHRVTPQSGPMGTWPESPANYADLARETRTVQSLSAITFGTALVNVGTETVRASQLYVTGGVFQMLGATAEVGRFVTAQDDRLDAPLVAVLSDAFWRAHFGADRTVVGKSVDIDGKPTTIVGVAPAEFRIPHGGNVLHGDVWMPMRFTPEKLAQRGNNSLLMLGRLSRGMTPSTAQQELRTLFAGLVQQYPQLRGENLRVAPLVAESEAAIRKPLLLLFGAVCMVLCIAATNVAALLLARGVHRRREMAVRTALGASRWHVMRPAIVESCLIAIAGTVLGLALAVAAVRGIGAMAAAQMPQLGGLTVDARVVAFGVALALVVALVCAAVPAWRNAAVDPQDALRGGRGSGGGRENHRALRTLVVGEIALSLMLLIGAGLVLRAFNALLGKDPGFETEHVVTMNVTLASARYADASPVQRFLDPALQSVSALPGVESAGSINLVPYVNWGWNSNVRYEGTPGDNPTQQPLVEERSVSPGFFAVTRQRLIAGRLLDSRDNDGKTSAPAVVVNEALAKRDFKGADPVGRRFYISDTSFATIVGEVSDIRNVGPFSDPKPEMYWNYLQSDPHESSFPIMIRARGDVSSVIAGARAAIRAADPTAAISDVAPMTTVIARSLGRPRFYVAMLGSFAIVALVLTIAGLYGILSYAVAQRTRELGIRVALGSSRGRLVRLVAFDGVSLVAVGLVIGFVGSYAVTHLMLAMLYGVSPLDRNTWLAAALALIVPTVLATLIPALRASAADPVVAMRVE